MLPVLFYQLGAGTDALRGMWFILRHAQWHSFSFTLTYICEFCEFIFTGCCALAVHVIT